MKAKKVAIIGSGPCGLAVANKLISNGFKVTVFDELKEFGGMLAYGIPEFRIPLKSVKDRINCAKKSGVIFKKKKIESVKKLLHSSNFDIVVIAIGAGTGTKSGFINENSKYVIDGLDFLLKDKLNNKKMVGKGQVVGVIGGGNSAIDTARVVQKQGAKATIIYRRTENEMPALKSEIDCAKKDLVGFEFLLAPKELVFLKKENSAKIIKIQNKCKLICSVMKLGEVDLSGRRKPIESSEVKEFIFDKVIVAVGQQNKFEWLEKEGVKTNGKTILVDEKYQTSLKNVYACGDVVTGAKTIGEAVLTGTKCAESIISIS